eukprot:scaffold80865_cov55-Attheya_sp.AAC.6
MAHLPPPPRSPDSYKNGLFAIVLYFVLTYLSWKFLPFILRQLFGVVFGVFCFAQVFGLWREYWQIGDDWQQNPLTGEWSKPKYRQS